MTSTPQEIARQVLDPTAPVYHWKAAAIALAKALLSERSPIFEPPSFKKLAHVHRGWCNYCGGNLQICRDAPRNGCSLRDCEVEIENTNAATQDEMPHMGPRTRAESRSSRQYEAVTPPALAAAPVISSDKKETPRTDAALRHQGSKYHDVIIRCERLIECSRQLERELTEAEDAITNWYVAAAPYATPETLNEALSATRDSDDTLVRLIELIRAMDLQATKITHVEGDEEVVDGYRFNTGCWHRILGMIAGHDASKWIQTPEGQARIREASERARATIEELDKARAIDWDKLRQWRATF